jgi:hypothetical protein
MQLPMQLFVAKVEGTSTEEQQKLLMLDNQQQTSPSNPVHHNSNFSQETLYSESQLGRLNQIQQPENMHRSVVIQLHGNQTLE